MTSWQGGEVTEAVQRLVPGIFYHVLLSSVLTTPALLVFLMCCAQECSTLSHACSCQIPQEKDVTRRDDTSHLRSSGFLGGDQFLLGEILSFSFPFFSPPPPPP